MVTPPKLLAKHLAAALLLAALLAPPAEAREVTLFRGLNASGLAARDNVTVGEPSDSTGAIGSRHYVEVVNSRIAVYERRGLARAAELDAHGFWGGDPSSTLVDPQIAWDRQQRRWYYVMLRNDPIGGNQVLFAWSRGADPSDLRRGWCRMAIPVGAQFDDFPRLGFSRNHVLVGTNVFDLGTREFEFGRVWAIGKPGGGPECEQPPVTSLGSAEEPLREADGRLATTPAPAVPARASNRGWVIAADCIEDDVPEEPGEESCVRAEPVGRQLTVWHVEGPPHDPRIVRDGGIRVPTYRVPKPVPQPGTNRRLDAGDTRLTQAVSNRVGGREGRLLVWTQHTVARDDGSSKVRWYAIDPERLEVARRGTVTKRRNWAFNAAISPTRRGDAAIVQYNVGGRDLLPQIRAQVADRAQGGEITLGRSAAPQEDCDRSDPYCVWGDYPGATFDPTRPNVVWGTNQAVAPKSQRDQFGSHWRTRNFALRAR